ncbi:MAG: hypothetical protein HGB26_01080 [Desulfobulbaceae bacterium]|nr:hypothetical protein [Desulfobulbaceae bacterium]
MNKCGRFTISLDDDNEWFNAFPQKSKLVNHLLAKEFAGDSVNAVQSNPDVADAYKIVKAQKLIRGDFERK